MDLFQYGEFSLHSGQASKWKIECDSLTDGDLRALAFLITKLIRGPFNRVQGVPTGGLRLARFLEPYCSKDTDGLLIVDDVLTTGKSMEEAFPVPSNVPVYGAVLFARGKCPSWVKPVFQVPEELW